MHEVFNETAKTFGRPGLSFDEDGQYDVRKPILDVARAIILAEIRLSSGCRLPTHGLAQI
jgi:hypothetical protein